MYFIRMIIFIATVSLIIYCLSKYVIKIDKINIIIIIAIFGMLSCFIFMLLPDFLSTNYEYQFSYQVVAMQDNQTYIISRYGSVDSTLRYYYMIKSGNGYKSKVAPQNQSIIYTTNNKPEMKYYKQRYTNRLARLIWGEYNQSFYTYKYEFYIPEGSIKQDFNVDLK